MFLYLLLLRTGGCGNYRCSHHRGWTRPCGAMHVAVSRWHHALPYVSLGAHKDYVELQDRMEYRHLLDMDFRQSRP